MNDHLQLLGIRQANLPHNAIEKIKVYLIRFKLDIAMKISALFLTICILQASAFAEAQVTIKVENASLEHVLNLIKKQTRVLIFYNQNDIVDAKRITVDLKEASLSETFSVCMSGQNLKYSIEGNSVFISKIKKQTSDILNRYIPDSLIQIQGKVLGLDNKGIAGATVTVKGSDNSTSTQFDGSFLLKSVKTNATLLISSIGYDPKIVKVNGETTIAIKMDVVAQEMKEVTIVNTGYQKLPKERSTGSYAFVDSALFNRFVSTEVLDRLDGTVPGILFDKRNPSESFIQIRGLYTLTETISSPLIVLDNFPYAGDINNINPNDVENITILKDAASTSIWGAKAGNGVIVITTKRGKLNQPFRLNIITNLTSISSPNLFDLPQMSSSDFIDVETMLFKNGYYNGMIARPKNFSITPVVDILNKLRKNEIDETTANAKINELRSLDLRNDFSKYFYQNGFNQQYALNLSGGSNMIAYYLSVGFDKNLSFNVGDKLKRMTANSSITITPIKRLQITIANSYIKSNGYLNGFKSYPTFQINGSKRIYPYAQLANVNGVPLSIADRYNSSYLDTAGNGKLLDWKYRPIEEQRLSDNTSQNIDFITNLSAKYEILPDLNAEIIYRYENQTTQTDNYNSQESFFARNLINRFTQINGNDIVYNVPLGGILENRDRSLINQGLRGQLNFSKHFGEHSISILAGSEFRETTIKIKGQRLFGFDKESLTNTNVDNVNRYPIYTGGTDLIPSTSLGYQEYIDKLVSFYGNAAYVYKSKYTINLSARQDASNLFGVSIRNKWKPLWSAGISWNVSNESFFNSNLLQFLNLRMTYGFSGNVNNSIAAVTTIRRQPAFFQSINIPFANINNVPNPELGWEKINTLNLGLDFSLKNRFLTGSIEYYVKKSSDVIADKLLDPTSGSPSLRVNSANMKGSGVDIQLNLRSPNKSEITWNSTLNFSLADYKVTKYLIPRNNKAYASSGGSIFPIEGLNPFEVVSFKWGGLNPENGNPRGILNGKPTENYDSIFNFTTFDDQVKHGSALPRIFGNFLNTINWKGVSLSANITYRLGYYFRKPTISYYSLFQNNDGHSDFSKRWQQKGDELKTTIPSMVFPDLTSGQRDNFFEYSEVNVDKGDHVRLEDIRVSYLINSKLLKSTPIQSVQVYFLASNLNILLWKANKWGIDPNFPGYNLKPGKNISFGATLSF